MHSVKDSFYITPSGPSPIQITKEPISIQYQELEPEVANASQMVFRIRYPTPDALLDPNVLFQLVLIHTCAGNNANQAAANNQAVWPENPWQLWKYMNSISVTWNGVTYSMPQIKEYTELLMYSDNQFKEMCTKSTFSPVDCGRWLGTGGKDAHDAPANDGGANHPWLLSANVSSSARFRAVLGGANTFSKTHGTSSDQLFLQPLPIFPFRYADSQIKRFNPIPFVSELIVRMDFSFGAVTDDMPISRNAGGWCTHVNPRLVIGGVGEINKLPRLLLKWYIRPPTVAPLPNFITLGGFPTYRYFSEQLPHWNYLAANSVPVTYASRHYSLRGVPSRLWIVLQKKGADVGNTIFSKINYAAMKSVNVYVNGRAIQKNLSVDDCWNLWMKNGPVDSCLTRNDMYEGGKCICLLTGSDLGQEYSQVAKRFDLWITGTWEDLCRHANAAGGDRPVLHILAEFAPGNITVGKQFARLHEAPLVTESQVMASSSSSSKSSKADVMDTDDSYQSRV